MRRLEHRVALVTGGATGLGLAIAKRLADEGAIVVISDIQVALGQSVAKEEGFSFFEQDVSDEAQWDPLVAEIEARFGRLDILVNNAGIIGPRDAVDPESARLSDWQRIFAINVDGVFLGCRAAIPAMRRAGGGSIVNISSIAGLMATPYAMAYGATKAAVRQMTKSVAQHCAEKGLNIRCNSVHPGNVHTPSWDKAAEEAAQLRGVKVEQILQEISSRSPMGTLTLPEDVAAAVAFLVSDDGARITGTKVIVDAGSVNCDTFHLSTKFKSVIRNMPPDPGE